MPFGNRKIYFRRFLNKKKIILKDLPSSVLSQFKKIHPSGYLKINNCGIFQISKFRNFNGKIL